MTDKQPIPMIGGMYDDDIWEHLDGNPWLHGHTLYLKSKVAGMYVYQYDARDGVLRFVEWKRSWLHEGAKS